MKSVIGLALMGLVIIRGSLKALPPLDLKTVKNPGLNRVKYGALWGLFSFSWTILL